jgi:MSHA pilin protein MshA
MPKQQGGFTLIELVLVIVILGILAATALPRFSDLSTQARISAVNGLAGSVRSGASIARATLLARGLANNAANVIIDGAQVDFVNGYPAGNSADNIADMLSDFTGFTYNQAVAATFTNNGAPTPATCAVTYNESAAAGAFPVITVNTAGC